MRLIALALPLIALAACDVAPMGASNEPANFTPVIWKTNTPVATRAADREACELAALGVTPNTTPEDLQELIAIADPEQRKRFVDSCMSNKGYTVTEGRVCTAADRSRGQLMVGSTMDDLPPLSAVRCFDPQAGGFVAA